MLAKMSFVLGTFLFSFFWPRISLCQVDGFLSPDELPPDMMIALPPLPTNLQPFTQSTVEVQQYLKEGNNQQYTAELERIVAENPDDDEIALFVYIALGNTWDTVAGPAKESQREYYEKALGYFVKGRDIAIKDKQKYRLHLAHIYDGLGEVYEHLGNYSSALEVYRTIAEEYSGVGTGNYLNKLAAGGVNKVSVLSRRLGLSANELREDLLNTASENKGNLIGFQALTEIVFLEESNGDFDAASKTLQLLKDRNRGKEFVGHINVRLFTQRIKERIVKRQQHEQHIRNR